jgi:hypothetical protein
MKSLPRELMAVERLLEQQAPDGPSVALRSRTLDAVLNVLPIDSLPEQQSLSNDSCMPHKLDAVSALSLLGMSLSLAWIGVGWLFFHEHPSPDSIRPPATLQAQARAVGMEPGYPFLALDVAASDTPAARSASKEPAPHPHYMRTLGDNPLPVASDEVGVFLKRQAPLIDLIRYGTERDQCRFNRDWSRPKVWMLVQETGEMRELARLLSLSARRQAVDGHPAEAIADVARLSRMGEHAARDPLGISSFVGMAIDGLALSTLAEVLPKVTHADQLNAIDPLRLSQASEMLSAAKSALLADEALYFNNAADIADKRIGWSKLYDSIVTRSSGSTTPFGVLWVDPFYRNFVLRGDVDDFRRRCRGGIHLMSNLFHFYHRDPDARRRGLAESSKLDGAGLYSQLFMPAFSSLNGAGWRSEARRNIAGVLLAATRYRLATGSLPESLEALVPEYLPYAPVDVFAQDHALLKLVSTDSELTVYSIGDNCRDDGGPRPESEPSDGKDDIGLSMKR